MNTSLQNNTCDLERLESFLSGDLSNVEERDFTLHLNTCESCRRSLQQQAAEPEAWTEAERLLKPSEFDLGTAEADCDSAFRTRSTRQPLQIQNVLSALGPTDDPAMLGRLGGYEVSGVVGAGGMGVVLKAIDKSLDRTVAIKVLAPHLATSGAARKRFSREAKAAAAVLHPNVIAIHSVSNDESLPYLVMPYVRGTSLQKRLDNEGPLSLQEILRIGSQIAAGLAAAHAQGLVHRDIKPANILLEDGVERVTITDFGLARAVDDATITHSGVIAGTPQYMSPEQARGEAVDGRSDLFSLGSVLYAICTGRPPFRAETTYGVMRRITDDEPTSIREINPEIPEWLCLIISRLMSKRADERFQSAAEVSELFEKCLAHVQQPATVHLPAFLAPPPLRSQLFSISRSSLGVIAMIATLLLGVLAVVGWNASEAPEIAGKWTGEGWGEVKLDKTDDGYDGTYTDTFGKQAGEIKLKWSRVEQRFNGIWKEGKDRFGKVSIRLVGDEIRGAWTTSKESKIDPGRPRLADLSWVRSTIKSTVDEVPGKRIQLLLSAETHSQEMMRKNKGFDGLSIMGHGFTGTINGKASNNLVVAIAHGCRLESFEETEYLGRKYWKSTFFVPTGRTSDQLNRSVGQNWLDVMKTEGVEFRLDHYRDQVAKLPQRDEGFVVEIYCGRGVKQQEMGKLVASLNDLKGVVINLREDGGGDTIKAAFVHDPSHEGEKDADQIKTETAKRAAIGEALRAAKVETIRWIQGNGKLQDGPGPRSVPGEQMPINSKVKVEKVDAKVASPDLSLSEIRTEDIALTLKMTQKDTLAEGWSLQVVFESEKEFSSGKPVLAPQGSTLIRPQAKTAWPRTEHPQFRLPLPTNGLRMALVFPDAASAEAAKRQLDAIGDSSVLEAQAKSDAQKKVPEGLIHGEHAELGKYRVLIHLTKESARSQPTTTVDSDTNILPAELVINLGFERNGTGSATSASPVLLQKGQIVAASEFKTYLEKEKLSLIRQHGDGATKTTTVRLNVDRDVRFDAVTALMKLCQEVGFQKFALRLEEEAVEKFVLEVLRTPFEFDESKGSWQDGAYEMQVLLSLNMVRPRDRVVKTLLKVVDRSEKGTMDQRRLAMMSLGGLAPKQVIPLLIKELEGAEHLPAGQFKTSFPYHEIAVLEQIGEEAKDAIPVLIKLLDSPDGLARESALLALVKIGPSSDEVMNAIAARFGKPDEPVWSRAIYEVGRYGKQAKPLGPTFVKLLSARPHEARIWAAQALIKSGFDEGLGFETLIGDVAEGHPVDRGLAATALAALGRQAEPMIPKLRAFENDPDAHVAKEVRDAIRRIEKDDRILTHAEEAAKTAASRKAAAEALDHFSEGTKAISTEAEYQRFEGTWRISVRTIDHAVSLGEFGKDGKHVIKDRQMGDARISLDPSKTPREIDIAFTRGPDKGKVLRGIYEWVDDARGTKLVRISVSTNLTDPGDGAVNRPKDFKTRTAVDFAVWEQIKAGAFPGGISPKESSQNARSDATELKKFQGTWVLVSSEKDGEEKSEEKNPYGLTFSGTHWKVHRGDYVAVEGTLRLVDVASTPMKLDLLKPRGLGPDPTVDYGIYEWKEDTLRYCVRNGPTGSGGPGGMDISKLRPTEFATKDGDGRILYVWKRAESEPPKDGAESATRSAAAAAAALAAEKTAGEDGAATGPLEFLAEFPNHREQTERELKGLTAPQFEEAVKARKLRFEKTTKEGDPKYYLPTGDGHTVIVMFRGGRWSGIQRIRGEDRPDPAKGELPDELGKPQSGAAPKWMRHLGTVEGIKSIAYSPDGKLIAVANGNVSFPVAEGWKRAVVILDAETGKALLSLPLETKEEKAILAATEGLPHFEVGPLAFSPDGKVLAVGTGMGQVKLFNARTGEFILSLHDSPPEFPEKKGLEKLKSLRRAMGGVGGLAFSPDGSLLVTSGSSFEDVARNWGGERRLGRLVTGPGRLKVWEVKTGVLKHDLVGHSHVEAVSFSADGNLLASAGRWEDASEHGNGVIIWNSQTGKTTSKIVIEANRGTHAVVFSPTNKLVAIGSQHYDKENDTYTTSLSVAYALSGITEWSQTFPGWANPKGFSPDGKSVLALCGGESIRFIKTETGEVQHEIKVAGFLPANPRQGPQWNDFAIAPLGHQLAIAGVDKERKGTIEIWNLSEPEATAKPAPKKDEEPSDDK
jgi:uncharacterized protein (TIGR03067 family)